MSSSRIAAARAQAAGAKAAMLAAAVLAFGAALLLAAWTRPAARVARKSDAVTTALSSQSDSFSEESDDGFSSGTIAPAQSTPQVATASS